jgi:hypothetical protein
MEYLKANRLRLFVVAILGALLALGWIDPAAAACGIVLDVEPGSVKELWKATQDAMKAMTDKVKANQDTMDKAIEQLKRGDDIHATTADALKKLGEESAAAKKDLLEKVNTFADRMHAVEQKLDKKPVGDEKPVKTAGELFAESDAYKAMIASKGFNSLPVTMDRKAAVVNATSNNDQPLVRADRVQGIIMPGLRRFTIRDLLPQLRTTSNLIEFASELLFTSGAGPQGGPPRRRASTKAKESSRAKRA